MTRPGPAAGGCVRNDTIAAIATPMARSAIGILRLSGPDSVPTLSSLFTPHSGRSLEDYPPRTLVYGVLRTQDGDIIDQALATFSRAPASYTGEDTAELQCHGSPAVLALALEALCAEGVRQAGPGEFTRRAFLNGKLDLMQAEAVADLIDAESPAAVRVAAGQLSGALSRRIDRIYRGLTDLMAHFCAVLDYPDEEIDAFGAQTISDALTHAGEELHALLDTYRRGRALSGGLPCAIVGRPNAGKSSLLNALLGYERAIVTAIPGTTRDTVEERLELGGVPVRLIDTAGLRETGDEVERLGVARSRAALEDAALALLVLDGSAPLMPEDDAAMAAAEQAPFTICAVSKSDLPSVLDADALQTRFPRFCRVSAATGDGLDTLASLVSACFPQSAERDGELLTNARQAGAAYRALSAVEAAREGLGSGVAPNTVLPDVECALSALGELTGRTVREDVTGRIFERFCVGK